jgi:hypothetical protein
MTLEHTLPILDHQTALQLAHQHIADAQPVVHLQLLDQATNGEPVAAQAHWRPANQQLEILAPTSFREAPIVLHLLDFLQAVVPESLANYAINMAASLPNLETAVPNLTVWLGVQPETAHVIVHHTQNSRVELNMVLERYRNFLVTAYEQVPLVFPVAVLLLTAHPLLLQQRFNQPLEKSSTAILKLPYGQELKNQTEGMKGLVPARLKLGTISSTPQTVAESL